MILFLELTFSSIQAQEKQKVIIKIYPGFTSAFSVGYGMANAVCIPCSEKTIIPGVTFSASAGYRFKKKILTEITAQSWVSTSEKKDPRDSRSNLLARISYYLLRDSPVFFSGGMGIGNYFFTPSSPVLIDDKTKTLGSFKSFSFSLSMGAGYEWYFTPKFSLISAFHMFFSNTRSLEANEMFTLRDQNLSRVADISLAFRWTAPLPRKNVTY